MRGMLFDFYLGIIYCLDDELLILMILKSWQAGEAPVCGECLPPVRPPFSFWRLAFKNVVKHRKFAKEKAVKSVCTLKIRRISYTNYSKYVTM